MIYFKINEKNQKIYTLNPEGAEIATPCRYTPEDVFSEERIIMKRRHKIFPFDSELDE